MAAREHESHIRRTLTNMQNDKHDLIHEFPQYREKIHELKMRDTRFAKLFASYHEVDHEIHRIEQNVETPSDAYSEDLKKRRIKLKDELYSILKTASG